MKFYAIKSFIFTRTTGGSALPCHGCFGTPRAWNLIKRAKRVSDAPLVTYGALNQWSNEYGLRPLTHLRVGEAANPGPQDAMPTMQLRRDDSWIYIGSDDGSSNATQSAVWSIDYQCEVQDCDVEMDAVAAPANRLHSFDDPNADDVSEHDGAWQDDMQWGFEPEFPGCNRDATVAGGPSPAVSETLPFIKATKFRGAITGYCFTTGTQGLGYYDDRVKTISVAKALEIDQPVESATLRLDELFEVRHEPSVEAQVRDYGTDK